MSWIKTIDYNDADSTLKRVYDRVKGPKNTIDNILKIHSLRPHTLTGHMALYKNVIHNFNNSLPKWFLESIGVYVSFLNHCDYCVEHHFAGLKKLWHDNTKADSFLTAIQSNSIDQFFDKKHYHGMAYAKKLTLTINKVSINDIAILRESGFTDGEILEINQVTSYFNYANRTVLGLGVHLKGDILGLSPNNSNDPDNWKHQ